MSIRSIVHLIILCVVNRMKCGPGACDSRGPDLTEATVTAEVMSGHRGESHISRDLISAAIDLTKSN